MPVTDVVVIVTAARSPRVLATNKGTVIIQRDANPCKEGNALARRANQKVVGSNPSTGKAFSHEIFVKVCL